MARGSPASTRTATSAGTHWDQTVPWEARERVAASFALSLPSAMPAIAALTAAAASAGASAAKAALTTRGTEAVPVVPLCPGPRAVPSDGSASLTRSCLAPSADGPVRARPVLRRLCG